VCLACIVKGKAERGSVWHVLYSVNQRAGVSGMYSVMQREGVSGMYSENQRE